MSPSTKRKIRKIIAPIRRAGLKNKTITIISNNCWGGIIYDKFGIRYQSPTIGLSICPTDFIKFIKDLKHYLSLTPMPICSSTSGYSKYLGVYKARLDDIVINFIHYSSMDEAISKWEKRKKRVDFDNLLIKFSDSTIDGIPVTDSLLNEFSKIGYHKIFLTSNEERAKKYSSFSYYFPKADKLGEPLNESKQTDKIIGLKNIKKLLNSIRV